MKQLIGHADDGLMKFEWDMGKGPRAPSFCHAEFKKAWITWIENGAYAPKAK